MLNNTSKAAIQNATIASPPEEEIKAIEKRKKRGCSRAHGPDSP